MFEALTYENLQIYWWIIISLLGGFLVFLLFVQGGQTLMDKLSNNEEEKTVIINIIGHKWEFTFTTLVVFGGAFFASFPLSTTNPMLPAIVPALLAYPRAITA